MASLEWSHLFGHASCIRPSFSWPFLTCIYVSGVESAVVPSGKQKCCCTLVWFGYHTASSGFILTNAMQFFNICSQVWESQRNEHLAALAEAPVDLSGVVRWDAPGHSAKFLTYCSYLNQLGKILHSELVRVKELKLLIAAAICKLDVGKCTIRIFLFQCPEASTSSKMEEGCICGIAFLKLRDIIIHSFTTDRLWNQGTYETTWTHNPAFVWCATCCERQFWVVTGYCNFVTFLGTFNCNELLF